MDIRVIPGHEMYGVSPDGAVWSRHKGNWRQLAPSLNGKGYVKVKLTAGRTRKVHSIVAEVFIGPRPHGMDVNHRDGNKQNNAVENLEYCTRRENMQHARALGLCSAPYTHTPKPIIEPKQRTQTEAKPKRCGSAVVGSKLSPADVVAIRQRLGAGVSMRTLGAIYGVSATQVMRIGRREKWAHVE